MTPEEIGAIAEAVARQTAKGMAAHTDVGQRIAASDPACIVTCARGRSDQAAHCFRYLVEIGAGIPEASTRHRKQSAVLEVPGFGSGFDDLAVAGGAIKPCGSHLGVAEDTVSEGAIGVRSRWLRGA